MLISNLHLQKLKSNILDQFDWLRNKTVILVDYPLYNNVGDWLIYHGTLELFRLLDVKIEKQYCLNDYEWLLEQTLSPHIVILLHGGGNFGDIYPAHQTLRRQIITRFTENSIVMLPQSVFFQQPDAFDQDAVLFASHQNLTLFVRDIPSKALLLEYPGLNVKLCPDLATLLLGTLPFREPKSHVLGSGGILCFRRRDVEAKFNSESGFESGFDWQDMLHRRFHFIRYVVIKLLSAEKRLGRTSFAIKIWSALTWKTIYRASQYFQCFDEVDTDRLHGMILANLLGVTVRARDNSYGKLGRYKEAWYPTRDNKETI